MKNIWEENLPVGCDDIGLPLDQMLSFLARDFGYGGEGVAEVGSSTLHAVPEERKDGT